MHFPASTPWNQSCVHNPLMSCLPPLYYNYNVACFSDKYTCSKGLPLQHHVSLEGFITPILWKFQNTYLGGPSSNRLSRDTVDRPLFIHYHPPVHCTLTVHRVSYFATNNNPGLIQEKHLKWTADKKSFQPFHFKIHLLEGEFQTFKWLKENLRVLENFFWFLSDRVKPYLEAAIIIPTTHNGRSLRLCDSSSGSSSSCRLLKFLRSVSQSQ